MSLNPRSEARYRNRLALDHLRRAENLYSMRDWAGAVSTSQLAVENFAKAVIALFEVPTWGHDPSTQLNNLTDRMPPEVTGAAKDLSLLASEIAPEHGRASYGEPTAGLTPNEIYKEAHASDALDKAREARKISAQILKGLGIVELA